jgi:hypothetical protein
MENETAETKMRANQPDNTTIYEVKDDKNLEEKDLERSFLFEGNDKNTHRPVREGQPMGGQNFGNNNLTQASNHKNNPPQNAGEGNAYFSRTQPAEEHPEDSNFTVKNQQGTPGEANDANIPGPQELPDQQKVGEPEGSQNRVPNPQQDYREGTADDDGHDKSDRDSSE